MTKVNVHDAKTHLSKYLARVEAGETIVICRHNRPIAEVRPVEVESPKPRLFGTDEGRFTVGPEFFEPLPEELMRYFRGERED